MDFQATTPLDPRVLDKMMPYLTYDYGNPHSRTHKYGWDSEKAVESARVKIAELINADPKEIIFTSGATESNNIALKGTTAFYESKKHVITSQIEHKCVLDSCRMLQSNGVRVDYLKVDENGLIDLKELDSKITKDTCVVSIMAVNNEIGVIQNIEEIGRICKKHKVYFHTDCAQGVGKIPIDVNKMNIDIMSISAHKLYGPKGIGALYVRRRNPRVRITPIVNGGGQERGLRSGTVPTPLCVGFGEACKIAKEDMEFDTMRIKELSKRFVEKINSQLKNVKRNGLEQNCYSGCVNLSFAYVEGESLLMSLKDVALSSGSACTSASLEPSYVLRALGADEDMAHSSIRFGIGRFTTKKEIDTVARKVIENVTRLREMSPLWELVQEGIDLKTINWSQH